MAGRRTPYGPWVREGYELLLVTPTSFKIRHRGRLGRSFELTEGMTSDARQARVNSESEEVEMDAVYEASRNGR